MIFSQLAVIVVFLISSGISAYPKPGACTGHCFAHDPFLIQRADRQWFRFNTGQGMGIWQAANYTGPWVFKGEALPGGSISRREGHKDLWAPDVLQVGTTYYLTYAISLFGSQNSAIGVATSATLEPKSWIDHGETGVISKRGDPCNAIDSNLIKVGNEFLMNFGSWNEGIFQVGMTSPPTKISGKPYNIAGLKEDPRTGEAPSMFQHASWYYILYSRGLCCGFADHKPALGKEYNIIMCRSQSPKSGFVGDKGHPCKDGGYKTLLASHDVIYAPGGQGMTMTPDGPILYYHYANITNGIKDSDYLFGWNRMQFKSDDDWPFLV